MKLAFVEKKHPDTSRIAELLGESRTQNSWANRGPLYWRLKEAFARHLDLPGHRTVVPMSNGGVALESMARLHSKWAGRKLRWVASAYTFQNLGRGYFNDVIFVDCDERGLLDCDALAALDVNSYDGIIATNPFGIFSDFSALSEFAAHQGKVFMIDNASGLNTRIPDIPWQSFSLHHTKPYGMGEGGLALVPSDAQEELYALVNYGQDIEDTDSAHWLGNGKLSDISAAFLIDRLEQAVNWRPRSLEQRERIIEIAALNGFRPLHNPETTIPMTSIPLLAPKPVSRQAIDATRNATFAKYYRPLADLPRVTSIYANLVNVPCHGDVVELLDGEIEADLMRCLELDVTPETSTKIISYEAARNSRDSRRATQTRYIQRG